MIGLLIGINALRCGTSEADSDSTGEAFADAGRTDVSASYQVEITARKDGWRVRLPGRSGQLITDPAASAAREIPVPLGAKILIRLKSEDFIYTFDLPDYGLKEIAVPGLVFQLEFEPRETGRVAILGEQLCGDPHAGLQGQLIIQRPRRLRHRQAAIAGTVTIVAGREPRRGNHK